MMKRLMFVPAVVLCLASPATALAQEVSVTETAAPMRAGADAAIVLPTGDWADISGVGFGVIGRFDYKFNPRVAFSGRPGFVYHLASSQELLGTEVDLSTQEILLMAGARFFLAPGLSLAAHSGLNLWSLKVSVNGESDSESETRMPLDLEIAYDFPNGLTLSGGALLPNVLLREDEEDMAFGLVANIGYSFAR